MKMVTCPKGHTYDEDVFSECPYCSNPGQFLWVGDPKATEAAETEILTTPETVTTVDSAVPQKATAVREKLVQEEEQNRKKTSIWILVLGVLVVGLLAALVIVLVNYGREGKKSGGSASSSIHSDPTEIQIQTEMPMTSEQITEDPQREMEKESHTEQLSSTEITEEKTEEVTEEKKYPEDLEIMVEKELKNTGYRQIFLLRDGGNIELRETCKACFSVAPIPAEAGLEPESVTWTPETEMEQYVDVEMTEKGWDIRINKIRDQKSEQSQKEQKNMHVNITVSASAEDGRILSSTFTVTILKSGWVTEGNNWYYYEGGKDERHIGWLSLTQNNTKKQYYFDESGVMMTGWQELKGNKKHREGTYFFSPKDGVMVTGKQKIDGKTYLFDDDGVFLKEE